MSGSVRAVEGRVYIRVRFAKGERLEERATWAKTEADATPRANLISELAQKLVSVGRRDLVRSMAREAVRASEKDLPTIEKAIASIVSVSVGSPKAATNVTFATFADRWTTGDLHRCYPDRVKLKNSKGDASKLRKYINPVIGNIPLSALRAEDAERVMTGLPEKIRSTTRRHVAQVIHRVLRLAAFPARLIQRSPLPEGFLPPISGNRARTFLYPKEEAALLACEDVPLVYRLFFGVLMREGMRLEELRDAEWSQFDLENGVFTLDENKTSDPRAWRLREDVVQALRLWKEHGKREKPFEQIEANHIAHRLRIWLRKAKVTRMELFETTDVRAQLRVHDLRATFVTLSMAAGKTEAWVCDRTGHRSWSMVSRYRRAARLAQELDLGELGPLTRELGWGITGGCGRKFARRSSPPRSHRKAENKLGGPSGTRTRTLLRAEDFKSPAYTVPPRGLQSRAYATIRPGAAARMLFFEP